MSIAIEEKLAKAREREALAKIRFEKASAAFEEAGKAHERAKGEWRLAAARVCRVLDDRADRYDERGDRGEHDYEEE